MKKYKSVVDEVYFFCIEKIEQGIWKPGDKLPSENEMEKELMISKVSIRAAMQRLRTKGLIVTHQGKGSFVSSGFSPEVFHEQNFILTLSNSQFQDIAEFREAVERKAFVLATERRSKEDIQRVEKAYQKMVESADDYRKYSRADMEFHLAMTRASGNELFYQAMLAIQKQFYLYLEELNKHFGSEKEIQVSVKGHAYMLEQLKKGDSQSLETHVIDSIYENQEKIDSISK